MRSTTALSFSRTMLLLLFLSFIVMLFMTPQGSFGFFIPSKPLRIHHGGEVDSTHSSFMFSTKLTRDVSYSPKTTKLFLFRKLFPKKEEEEDVESNVVLSKEQEDEQFNLMRITNENQKDIDTADTNTDNDTDIEETNLKSVSKKISIPFFAQIQKVRTRKDVSKEEDSNETFTAIHSKENDIPSNDSSSMSTNDILKRSSDVVVPPPPPLTTTTSSQLSPVEQAYALKAQAERTRLEAEKLDILLTMEKIDKLEKQLATKAVQDDSSKSKDVQKQIQALKLKLDGGTNISGVGSTNSGNSNVTKREVVASTTTKKKDLNAVLESVVAQTKAKHPNEKEMDVRHQKNLSPSEIEARVQRFKDAPPFMKDLVMKANGIIQPVEDSNYNATELILKMYQEELKFNQTNQISIQDKDYNKDDVPEFTQEQIDEVLEAVKMVPQFIKNMYGEEYKNNNTAIALMMLEEEWREGRLVQMPDITRQMIDDKLEEIKWIPQFLKGDNDTELAIELIKSDYRRNGRILKQDPTDEEESEAEDELSSSSSSSSNRRGLFNFGGGVEKTDKENMVEALFPQSTRKEGQEVKESLVKTCMSEILKDNVWMATAPPEKVPGGFIIRGKTKYTTGKELIDAIDKNMDKSKLKDQLSIFYVFDPTPVTKEQIDGGEVRSPVLFVSGPDVARDPAPIQRSIISAVAFGTAWYNALLPYLLNDKFMKLADEQLALADASMSADLDFLNDLSFPLFAATIGIQASHELAHIIAAQANGMNITTPTLVPSLATGLTGSITSLKAPPKDKQALFDFAISGPLVGMVTSALLLYFGMSLTVTMDAGAFSELPALPLPLLRQSSLVGGIIESISPGLLSVPDAASGSKALNSINIPLHPFAIAGYFGMMINAANLLPTGRTDGGRIATSLFGRSGAQLVSLITFIGMFGLGLSGSDLLLFYFSYVVFFQSELEIPQRNEVDDMDFSRVLLATATGVLVLLTLIPM